MPQFQYKVKRAPDDIATGVLEAESQRAAISRLRDMGYFPISVEEYTEEGQKESIRQAFIRVKLKDRNIFFRQLANLIESGMPITRALSTLVRQTEHPKMEKVIEQLRDDIQKGSTFAEALERHPKLFPAMYTNLVRAGEAGGMLEEVLWRIVAFGEKEEELKGKATSAMIYPAFLLLVGSAAIFILVSFVFPKFITVFEDFNAQLPLITRVVMGFCEFMGTFWWAVLLAVAGAVAMVVSYWRTPAGRRRFDRFWLTIPAVGGVVQRYEMAKFGRTLGALFDNGVPVLTALRITAETLTNTVISEEVDRLEGRVKEGDGLSEGLANSEYFPPLVVSMLAIGEESGRLGIIMKRIADAYDLEVDRAVKALADLLEPIMIVVMGIIIGVLVIAMLLPMLTLSANVG